MTDAIESELWENVRKAEDFLKGDEARHAGDRIRNIDAALVTHAEQVERLEAERDELTVGLAKAEAALEEAREALRNHFTANGKSAEPDEDVHAAVAAMAEEIGGEQPEPVKMTEGEARGDEPSDWVLAAKQKLEEAKEPEVSFELPDGISLCAGDDAMTFEPFDTVTDDLPAFADLSPTEQAEVVAVLDDDEPFEGLGDLGECAEARPLVIGSSSDVSDEDLAAARVADEREAASPLA